MKSRGLLAVACAAMLMAGCNKGNRASNTIANSNEAGTTGTACTASARPTRSS
jgi:hypothetical protein